MRKILALVVVLFVGPLLCLGSTISDVTGKQQNLVFVNMHNKFIETTNMVGGFTLALTNSNHFYALETLTKIEIENQNNLADKISEGTEAPRAENVDAFTENKLLKQAHNSQIITGTTINSVTTDFVGVKFKTADSKLIISKGLNVWRSSIEPKKPITAKFN